MSEPLYREPETPGSAHASDPAVQIERLLLAGLDLYFAAQYQDAINVWTRVAFIERGHSRARAYIERARSAIAEQQRQADELVQRSRDAYEQGDVDGARRLLTGALDRGDAAEEALALLQHLNRFDATVGRPPVVQDGPTGSGDARSTARRWRWGRALAVTVGVSAAALGAAPLVSWFGGAPVATPSGVTAVAEPLPVPRVGAMTLDTAREQYAGGRLVDALRSLAKVDVGDPAFPAAERLRGDIQRDLLAAARQSAVAPAGEGRR